MAGNIVETSRPAVSVKDFSRQEIIDFLKSKLADRGVHGLSFLARVPGSVLDTGRILMS